MKTVSEIKTALIKQIAMGMDANFTTPGEEGQKHVTNVSPQWCYLNNVPTAWRLLALLVHRDSLYFTHAGERVELFDEQPITIVNIELGYKLTDEFDGFEISPVYLTKQDSLICNADEANAYSLYAHRVEGGAICIADCQTEEMAVQLRDLLVNAIELFKTTK